MTDCDHGRLVVESSHRRVGDAGRFSVSVTIKCAACNAPFRFADLPRASAFAMGASCSEDRATAALLIEPERLLCSPPTS